MEHDAVLPPTLDTARLRLRPMTHDDAPFVASMLGDPETMRYYPRCYTYEEAEGWVQRTLDRYAKDGHAFWLVEDRTERTPIGQVGLLMQFVEERWQPEIGYMLDSTKWRRGFASEAAQAVRDYAFGTLGKPEVISLIRPVNVPSQGVARRIGMAPAREAIFRELRHIIFAMTRETWLALVPERRS